MGKKYKKFIWPKYDERNRPGMNDVLEEDELVSEEELSEPEVRDESLYTAQEVWESRIKFRKRTGEIWSRMRIGSEDAWEYELVQEEELPEYELVAKGELAGYTSHEGWEYELVSEKELARYDPQKGWELPFGCRVDSDCPSGQICVFPSREKVGTCFDPGSVSLIIAGIVDNRTCNYCRAQIGTILFFDPLMLPPFHEHCRCWAEFVYW